MVPSRHAIHWLSWFSVMLMILVSLSNLPLPDWIQYAPFFASALLFGLPHGAADHVTPFWMNRETITLRKLIRFSLLYLILVGLYLSWWYIAPSLAFLFFIMMTWFHWGQGDLYALIGLFNAQHLNRFLLRVATLLIRGGLPMFVPLLMFPDTYRAVANDTIGRFVTGDVASLAWLFDPTLRWYGGAVFVAFILFTFTWSWFSSPASRRSWWFDATETGLLFLYFSVVPPLLAVGLYFCLWHAVRHILRLQELNPDANRMVHAGNQWSLWQQFFTTAAPLTGGALILLALLAWAVPQTPQAIGSYLGIYLAFIAALTFPHTILVTWLDLRQGIWSSSPRN